MLSLVIILYVLGGLLMFTHCGCNELNFTLPLSTIFTVLVVIVYTIKNFCILLKDM